MNEENKNASFWQKNWFAWLCFILASPIGLFIMYTTREDYPTRWKIGAGLSLFAIVYWLATGEPVGNSVFLSILTVVFMACIGVLFDNVLKYWAARNDEDKTRFKKRIKGSAIAAAVLCVAVGVLAPSEDEEKEIERIAAMTDSEKTLYEQQFAEYKKSMSEDDARTKAIAAIDANTAVNEKLAAMTDEEKSLYEQKFAEYSKTTDEFSARTKAVEEVEADTAAKNKALQEMYDKQAQYEKWLAQKAEQERKEQEKAAEEQKRKESN